MFASGVPKDVKDGDLVTISKPRWVFRPGDLVKVTLSTKNVKPGFYIPNNIICSNSSSYWVFKLIRNANGTYTAHKISVTLESKFNNFFLIKSPSLKAGDLIAFSGSHFITQDEIVNVKFLEEVSM